LNFNSNTTLVVVSVVYKQSMTVNTSYDKNCGVQNQSLLVDRKGGPKLMMASLPYVVITLVFAVYAIHDLHARPLPVL
ncbi:hypothetical protein Ancab_007992, partial [Ancistrocladus abbreviatus]